MAADNSPGQVRPTGIAKRLKIGQALEYRITLAPIGLTSFTRSTATQLMLSQRRPALELKLTLAEERVALGHDRIAYQREVVSGKEDNGLHGAIARAILGQLETSQRIHIAERDRLLAEVGLWSNPELKISTSRN
jgi:hypothetical protein